MLLSPPIFVAYYRGFDMLAIIGFGDHVQRNILPVLDKIREVTVKYIVVRNVETQFYKNALFTSNFSEVLEDLDVTSVYIATPIQSHFSFVKKAILAGKNVLCEKPLTTNLKDSKELVGLAQSNNVKLQEVVMYEFHEQFQWIKNYLHRAKNSRLIKIESRFQIPHLAPKNIRYSKKKGGGALLDIGFYPLSMLISLLGTPGNVKASIVTQKNYSVDLSGLAILTYGEVYGVAEWGIGRIYKNEVTLEFEDHKVVVDRAFSKPSSFETKAIITKASGETVSVLINPDDHFYNLVTDFFSNNSNVVQHLNSIIERAKLLDVIKNNSL